MKNLLILPFLLFSIVIISQEQKFESSFSMTSKTTFESIPFKRTVIINDKLIIVTKYLNGNSDDLILNIDNTMNKTNKHNEETTLYYCTSVKKDELFDVYNKYIVVEYKSINNRKFKVCKIVDEVTTVCTTLN